MTCASCVGRVEKKLNRLDGVTATVNLATASASVDYDPASSSVDDLVRTVEQHRLHRRRRRPSAPSTAAADDERRARRGLPAPAAGRGAADLLVVLALTMLPGVPDTAAVRWPALLLATPGGALGRLAVPPGRGA